METEGTGPIAELRERLQTTLSGSYTLQRELGGGGMSRVFVAEDTRLGRRVVVKLLHPDLAAGLSAQRFEREILLAARLQHPHIVPFLSAGDVDGLPYYMMPFIDGETLRARFARDGALPVGDALRLVRELADALAYAHAHGVMHRDLKPENVLLSGGHAVIADFGVAKALASATLGGTTNEGAASADATTATALGVAVGTPAYMAPEQAAADPAADHRVDLYALGLIAYEALAGAHPFAARGPSEMLAAQLTQVPTPLAERRSNVPRAVATLVTRLLAKRPDDRPASAADVMRALDEATTPPDGTRGISTSRRTQVLTGIGLAAVGTVALLWWMRAKPTVAERAPVRPTPAAIRPLTFTGLAQDPEFSRDGRQIAYVENECAADAAQLGACAATLRVMDFHSGQSEGLLRAARVAHPHWSADGAWIAVLMTPLVGGHAGDLETYVVPRHGGVPRRLAPASLAEFGAGGDTLYIATAPAPGAPRFVRSVLAATGEILDSTALASSLIDLEGFHSSPNGRRLALRLPNRILLATPDRRVTDSLVFQNYGSLRWSARGDALYALVPGARAAAVLLKRVSIDTTHGRFIGGMETVLDLGPSGAFTFDVAPDGETLVRTGGTSTTTLWAWDRSARPPAPRAIDNSTQWLGSPALSADGQLVAYEATDEVGLNVYLKPFAGGGPRRPITRDSTGWSVWGWVPGTELLAYSHAVRPESLYAQEIPGGRRHVLGPIEDIPLADGGKVTLESSRHRLIFRTAAGAEQPVVLPDSLNSYLRLLFADADGGAAYVSTLRAAATARQHERWVRVDRASGVLGVVADLDPQQIAVGLAASHGEIVYATWVVRTEVGWPTVWQGRAGRSAVKLMQLPFKCLTGSLTMSADDRRFACLELTKRTDLSLVEHFDDRR